MAARTRAQNISLPPFLPSHFSIIHSSFSLLLLLLLRSRKTAHPGAVVLVGDAAEAVGQIVGKHNGRALLHGDLQAFRNIVAGRRRLPVPKLERTALEPGINLRIIHACGHNVLVAPLLAQARQKEKGERMRENERKQKQKTESHGSHRARLSSSC